jgi:hypothetical protein
MKKVLIMMVVLTGLSSLSAAAYADQAISKNYLMPIAQTGAPSLTAPTAKTALTGKEKRVHLITFSEVLEKVSTSGVYPALKSAEKWQAEQNPETILSQSQTVTCLRSSGCDAFVTIMYWTLEPSSINYN